MRRVDAAKRGHEARQHQEAARSRCRGRCRGGGRPPAARRRHGARVRARWGKLEARRPHGNKQSARVEARKGAGLAAPRGCVRARVRARVKQGPRKQKSPRSHRDSARHTTKWPATGCDALYSKDTQRRSVHLLAQEGPLLATSRAGGRKNGVSESRRESLFRFFLPSQVSSNRDSAALRTQPGEGVLP